MSASNMSTQIETYSEVRWQRPRLATFSPPVTVSSAPSRQGSESGRYRRNNIRRRRAAGSYLMKRIRIIHKTEYFYNQPVTFNPHRVLMRPREGHDVHIVRGAVDIAPKATVRWLRDIYDNAIAIVAFEDASDT